MTDQPASNSRDRDTPRGPDTGSATTPPRSDLPWMMLIFAVLVAVYLAVAAVRRSKRPPVAQADFDANSQRTGDRGDRPVSAPLVLRVKPGDYMRGLVVVPGTLVLPDVSVASDGDPRPADWDHHGFAPVESCGDCHAAKYQSFAATAHAVTARPATADAFHGVMTEGQNLLRTSHPGLLFRMEERGSEFFQIAEFDDSAGHRTHRERIDIVTGSGNHGQTLLTWHGDQLFQLPVSYFAETQRWINSPSYMDGVADFARPISPRCLECHSTFAQHLEGSTNGYLRESVILGITCQRCHGPGQEHVDYHRAQPQATDPRAIVHPSGLSRDRQMQLCEQCHSGAAKLLRPAWSYRLGEPLEQYIEVSHQASEIQGEVHTANQSARIRLSRCYQASPQLTCTTCHDPHRRERGDHAQFSRRCLQCHQADHCRDAKLTPGNCIDCHMPKARESALNIDGIDGPSLPQLRDHWIRVVPKTP